MILAKHFDGFWVLAGRAMGNSPGVSICVGAKMPTVGDMELNFAGYFYSRYVTNLEQYRFFPEIRWRGCKVTPEHWKPDSAEPILHVRMMPWDLNVQSVIGVEDPTLGEFRTRLAELGWTYDVREGATAWLHVDDLEKVEGPLPEGRF
jgi:hypothetical protein